MHYVIASNKSALIQWAVCKFRSVSKAKRAFQEAPEVQQCYYVTGEVDFILIVVVKTMGDYEALTKRLFFSDNNVKRFKSFVAMARVKVGLSVPLDARLKARKMP